LYFQILLFVGIPCSIGRRSEASLQDGIQNYDDVQHRVYGVVAFPPNLSGKGNVLILERTSMAGTECAWEFVADDSALLLFLLRIKRTDGTIPHFQLVLGSNNMNGSSGKSSILTWRVMN
jgi:hypothetical protein